MITDINHSKKELAETFFQRLVDSYGYLPEQMEFDVKVSPTSLADIAIWPPSFSPRLPFLKMEHLICR